MNAISSANLVSAVSCQTATLPTTESTPPAPIPSLVGQEGENRRGMGGQPEQAGSKELKTQCLATKTPEMPGESKPEPELKLNLNLNPGENLTPEEKRQRLSSQLSTIDDWPYLDRDKRKALEASAVQQEPLKSSPPTDGKPSRWSPEEHARFLEGSANSNK